MFEKALANILNVFLSDYIEEGSWDQKNIHNHVYDGFIVLENLILKSSVFDCLQVPISLSYGVIGRIEVRIPWNNLGNEPSEVIIDRVFLVLEPKYEWDTDARVKREQAIKQAKLATAEMFANGPSNSKQSTYGNYLLKWFLNSTLLNKIVDNIQLHVREVHLRYEDHVTCPTDFAVGISLESVHMQSREPEVTIPGSISKGRLNLRGNNTFHKHAQINHLAVYWNPVAHTTHDACTGVFAGRSGPEVEILMSRTIAKRNHMFGDRPKHHYLLQPVDISTLLDVSLNLDTMDTTVCVKIEVSDIGINFEDNQFREVISLSTNIANFLHLEQFSMFRPTLSPTQDPRAWWRYCINAVILQVKQQGKKLSWDELLARRDNKKVYIELWKRKLVGGIKKSSTVSSASPEAQDRLYQSLLETYNEKKAKEHHGKSASSLVSSAGSIHTVGKLNSEMIQLLDALEEKLSFEDILFFRSLAEKELSDMGSQKSWLGGVVSWAFGGYSEEEKSKFFEILRYDPDLVLSGLSSKQPVDLNHIMADVSVQLERGSLTLSLSTPTLSTVDTAGESLPFLELTFNTLDVVLILLGDGSHTRTTITLADLNVYEAHEADTKAAITGGSGKAPKGLGTEYNRLISRRIIPPAVDAFRTYRMDFEDRNSELLKMTIETFPPSSTDYEVSCGLVLQELEIILSPKAQWLTYFIKFVTWPEEQGFWSEMEMSALNQLADLKTRLDAKLDYMMSNHTDILLEVKVKAPLVILSESGDLLPEKPTDLLLVDLGYIYLCTERLAKLEVTRGRQLNGNSNQHKDILDDSMISDGTRSISPVVVANERTDSKKSSAGIKNTKLPPISPLTIHSDDYGGGKTEQQPKLQQQRRHLDTHADESKAGEGEVKENTVDGAKDAEGGEDGGHENPTLKASRSNSYTGLFNLEGDDEEELFDVFKAQLTQLEVYMVNSGENWRELTPQQITNLSIIDRFDISAEIHSSVLPWDSTLPPVKLYIDLPELHLRLSEDKLCRLVHFFSSLAFSSQQVLDSQYARIAMLSSLLEQRKLEEGVPTASKMPFSLPPQFQNLVNNKSGGDEEDELLFYDTLEGTGSASVRSRPSSGNEVATVSDGPRSVLSRRSIRRGGRPRDLNTSIHSKFSMRSGDISDDDSFQSANEFMTDEEANRRVQEVQYTLKQRESMRTKLMTELRFNEGGAGSSNTLYKALEEELQVCDREISHLQVAYVEALMNLEETKMIVEAEREENDLFRSLQQNPFRDNISIHELVAPTEDKAEDLNRLRTTLRDSIFKARPSSLKGINWELLYARVNISSVNITLSCAVDHHRAVRGETALPISSMRPNTPVISPNRAGISSNVSRMTPTPASMIEKTSNQLLDSSQTVASAAGVATPPEKDREKKGRSGSVGSLTEATAEIVTVKCKFTGINVKIKHRSMDTKLSLAVRDLDIIDAVLSKMKGGSVPVCLLTSEPSTTGITVPIDRFQQSGGGDLLRVKYEMSKHGSSKSSDGFQPFSNDVPPQILLRVHIGFLCGQIDQSTIAVLLRSVDKICPKSPSLTMTTPDNPSAQAPKQQPPKPPISAIPKISLITKLTGFHMSLIDDYKPVLTATTWAASVNLHLHSSLSAQLKLADLAIRHTFGEATSDSAVVFGRKPGCLVPMVVANLNVDSRINANIKTAPTCMVICPLMLNHMAKIWINGPIHLFMLELAKARELEIIGEEEYGDGITSVSKSDGLDVTTNEHQSTIGTEKTTTVSSASSSSSTASAFSANHQQESSTFMVISPNSTFATFMDSLGNCKLGNVDIDIGDLEVSAPNQYDDRLRELALSLSQIQVHLIWNDSDNIRSLESRVSIQGIGLRISGTTLIDTFTIQLIGELTTKDSEKLSGLQVVEGDTSLTDDPFPPKPFRKPQANSIQISAGISPIIIHIHERVLHDLGRWSNLLSEQIDELQYIISKAVMNTDDMGPRDMDQSSTYSTVNQNRISTSSSSSKTSLSARPIVYDGSVYLDVLFYEICLSVDVEETPLDESNKGSLSADNVPFGRYSITPSTSLNLIPLYLLSTRGLDVSFVGRTQVSGDETEVDSERSRVGAMMGESGEGNYGVLWELQALITSIDLCRHNNEREVTVKRILCTVATMPSSTELSAWKSVEMLESARCVSVVVSQATDGYLKIDVDMSNIHFIVVAEAMLDLTALFAIYLRSASEGMRKDTNFAGPNWRKTQSSIQKKMGKSPAVHLLSYASMSSNDDSSMRGMTNSSLGASKEISTSDARPSSIPLSDTLDSPMLGSSLNHKSVYHERDAEHHTSQAVKVILTQDSFQLPKMLKGIIICINVNNIGLWIPVDENEAQSEALHLNLDIRATSSYCPVMWADLENEEQNCWVTRASIFGPRLQMSKISYPCVYQFLPSNLESDVHTRIGKSSYAGKDIIAPMHIEVAHVISIGLSSNHDRKPVISNKLEAHVQDIEILLYSNFSALASMFENTVKPLQDIALILEVIAESPSDDAAASLSKGKCGVTLSEGPKKVRGKSHAEDEVTGALENLFEVLPYLPYISSFIVEVKVEDSRIFVVNDFYRQPATIGRIVSPVITVSMHCESNALSYGPSDSDLIKWKEMEAPKMERTLGVGMNINLGVEYQNPSLMAWEPLLETMEVCLEVMIPDTVVCPLIYWSFHEPVPYILPNLTSPVEDPQGSTSTQTLTPTSTNSATLNKGDKKSASSSSIDLQNYLNAVDDPGSSKISPSCIIKMEIREVINFNITTGLIEVILSTAQGIAKVLGHQEIGNGKNTPKADPPDLSMAVIRNDSGLPLCCWMHDYYDGSQMDVPINSEKPLAFDESMHLITSSSSNASNEPRAWSSSAPNTGTIARRIISLSVRSPDGDRVLAPIRDIHLEGCGSHVFVIDTDQGRAKRVAFSRGSNKYGSSSKIFSMLQATQANDNLCVVVEKINRGGVKMLLARSTLRISNTTALPFRIAIYEDSSLLWEDSVPPDSDVAIPAQYCHKTDARMYFQPIMPSSSRTSLLSSASEISEVEVPFPETPGLKKMSTSPTSALKPEIDSVSSTSNIEQLDEDLEKFPGNTFEWRRKLRQKKDSVDTLTYSHWVDFMRETTGNRVVGTRTAAFNCNFHVLTNGAPRSHHGENSGSCLLRQITISPPVVVRNLLACEIEVKLYTSKETMGKDEEINLFPLKPGETWPVMSVHAINSLLFSMRLFSANSSFRENLWSEPVTIKGCSARNFKDTTSLVSNIVFENCSNLSVQMDIIDHSGSRIINLFVPFWLVTSSSTDLVYQHDARYTSQRNINGSDDLCADQLFSRSQFLNKSENVPETGVPTMMKQSVPQGIGKCRGRDGVIIGPEMPIRGFKDAAYFDTQIKAKHMGQVTLPRIPMYSNGKSANLASAPPPPEQEGVNDGGQNIPYNITHCGYTDHDRATSTLRLRAKGTPWSKPFSLGAASSPTVVELTVPEKSMNCEDDDCQNANIGGSGWFGFNGSIYRNSYLYYFGILSTIADPPFERTKVVIIVDRFVVVNSVGQSIDVRQINSENVTTIHPREEVPVYWKPGKQSLQVRLSRYGWDWSGKFSLETEGEVPLRMRNEHDNTIFFVMCHVVKQGPRICVVLRGGEGVAPYRIENHTLESFRFRQGKFSTYSNLLPYHGCMYAWDEPQEPQLLTLDVSRSVNNGRSTNWRQVGVFAFDRLQSYDSENHLAIRVQAEGPIRVLQIHDKRCIQSSLNEVAAMRSGSMKVAVPVHTKFIVKLHSIGVSIIDSTPQELIYFSMKNILLQDSISHGTESFKLEVGRIQIDSQLWSTPYPAMFYPLKRVDQVIKERTDLLPSSAVTTTANNGQSLHEQNGRLMLPFSSVLPSQFLLIEFQRDFSRRGVEFFPNIVLKVAPFDLNLEGTIITSMISFVTDILSKIDNEAPNKRLSFRAGLAHSRVPSEFLTLGPRDKRAISTIVDATAVLQNAMSDRSVQSSSAAITSSGGLDSLGASAASVDEMQAIQQDSLVQSQQTNLNEIDFRLNTDNEVIRCMVLKCLGIASPPLRLAQTSAKLYVEKLDISEIRLNLSFNPMIAADMTKQDSIVIAALQSVLMAVGSTIAKIDNCPLKFKGITFRHEFAGVDVMGGRLAQHYAVQALNQVYLILGSSEALGNPVKLVKLISEGIWDFLYLPVIGLLTSPEGFWNGIMQGSKSLCLRTIASLCSTAGYMCTSIQVGIAALGLVDSPYLYQDTNLTFIQQIMDLTQTKTPSALKHSSQLPHRELMLARPRTWIYGIQTAVLGVVLEPLKGFRMSGTHGLLPGLWRGAIGVLSKPIYGIFGSLGRFLDTVAFELLPHIKGAEKEKLKRVRPPRFFRDSNIPLQPYSEEENIGQELLSRINRGSYRAEGYRWHCELPSGDISLVTSSSVLVVGDVIDYCEIRWECSIRMIVFIEVEYSPSIRLPASSERVDYGQNRRRKEGRDKKSKRINAPHEKVTVNIYYLPDFRRGAKQLSIRFLHKELDLIDHEAALEFLTHMIRRQPELQTEQLEEYFHKCGAVLPLDYQANQLRASSSSMTLSSTHTSQGPSGLISGQRTPHESTHGTALPSSGGSSGFMKLNSVFHRNMSGIFAPGNASIVNQHKTGSTPVSPRSSDASYIHQQQRSPNTPAVPGMDVNGLAPIIIPKVTSLDNTLSPSTRQVSSPITPRSVPQSPRSDNPLANSGGVGSAFTSRYSSRNKLDPGSPSTSDVSTTAEKGDNAVGTASFASLSMRISPSVSPRYQSED